MSKELLGRGIWYETLRNRYRVRLYRRDKIVHLSYHPDLESATAAYLLAKAERDRLKALEKTLRKKARSLSSQAEALGENLL